MTYSLSDFFCGAGGSSTGAIAVPGVTVRVASNHWQLAIETHNTNHQDADHICADLSQINPSLFPTTDLGWFSPECTNHSRAKGRKRDTLQGELWGETLPDAAAERSRATMWDVVRFTEHHQYDMVFVENVVEIADWLPFRAWLLAMESIGYDHQVVCLNSMHAQAYGLPAAQSRDRIYVVFNRRGVPKPDFERMQRPKAYCPTCDQVVDAIQAASPAHPRHGDPNSYYRAWSTARPVADPLATVTASGNHHALITSYYGNGTAQPVTEPVGTVTTVDRHALIMRNNTGGAEMVTPATEPVRTITTTGHQSVLTADDISRAAAQVDDVMFRMLEPSECKRAMAFPTEYVILGNRREQVRMAGNAVTPPAARDLIGTAVAALEGQAA